MIYHIDRDTLTIISGPHQIKSTYIKKLTRCGNPDILKDLLLRGFVPRVMEPLGSDQKYGDPIVSLTAVTFPAVDLTAQEIATAQEQSDAAALGAIEGAGLEIFFAFCQACVQSGVIDVNDPNFSQVKDAYLQWKTLKGA